MEKDRWLKTGLWGTIVTAICCFTPVLPWFLGILGLAALTGYLDYVLFPLLGIFLVITIYAASTRRRTDSRGRQP
ncbi:MAG: mercury resistance system transport protein MerF [Candidatus Methylomirabilales bacterium]